MIIMVHQTIIVRDSYIISITGRVREMKCLYNGFNNVQLMNIRVIENGIEFY